MGAGASSRSKQQATEVASEAAPSRARVANLGSQTSKQSTHNIDRLERGVEAQADALSMYGFVVHPESHEFFRQQLTFL
jgi:hypothetical protein